MTCVGQCNGKLQSILLFTGLVVTIAACAAGNKPHADVGKSLSSKPLPESLFSNWPKKTPDVAIVLSGEQHSYIKFCGCSHPQKGGFERRYNFMAKLKEKGWPLVAVDLGDLVYRQKGTVHEQTLMKYAASMKALNVLGYSAIGVGQHEFNLPLLEGLTSYTLQNPTAGPRVLAANLDATQRAQLFPLDGIKSMIGETVIASAGDQGPNVGVVTVVAPSVRDKIHDKSLKFGNNNDVLQAALKEFESKQVNLRVLLYQGTAQEAAVAINKIPQFQLVLCKSPQEEPPGSPNIVGNSMIVEIGYKGRYVGVVGAFKTGKDNPPYELHYQLVSMDEDYETDADKVKEHPVIQILEDYSQKVAKNDSLLKRYPRSQHKIQAEAGGTKVTFVGTDKCKDCHQAEWNIWKNSGHSHAFNTLVNHPRAQKPSLRQFDGECVVCHTIGFAYEGGYVNEQKTPHLKDVGCENCHGPASLHVANPTNPNFYKPLSPWKLKPTDRVGGPDKFDDEVLKRIDPICQSCHDSDNDPNFRFEKYWPKIEHGKKAAGVVNLKK